MEFIEQKIKGVFLIKPNSFVDDRGIFRRHFCFNEFSQNGIADKVKQANVSENNFAHTLRGFHYQQYPHGEGKTLSCLKGSIYDIIVDLRKESSTYMQWLSFNLDDKNRNSVHIPPGCANAFLTLEDNCLIQYYCSHQYAPDFERGIRFNDKIFNFKWPVEPKIISDKDNNHPDFDPNNSYN